jgi:fatty acid desaturase
MSSDTQFSLTDARAIVRDLFAPREAIYWIDFLTTFAVGQIFFGLTRHLYDIRLQPLWLRLALQLVTFSIQCACLYRAVMFIHEIVHLPERRFRAFRLTWNLLCGIPFLIPSFTYDTHLNHHRRRLFGTADDGEYLPLARTSPWYILLYLLQCLVLPPLVVVRFGLLTPCMWICPPLRRWIDAHASSLVMDPSYQRPVPTPEAWRQIRLQEFGCFMFIWGVVIGSRLLLDRWPLVVAVHGYLTAVVLILLNCLRTLASHRWWSDGREMTFVEQMLDSVTLDNDSPLAMLINPVGLRFHATHHLFPSMPYHNLRTAHHRLLRELPADSPYRRTVERSVVSVIVDLWQRASDYRPHSMHGPGSDPNRPLLPPRQARLTS